MEIKNPEAIYSFLGNLTFAGTLALFVLISVVAAFITANVIEKLFDGKGIRRIVVFLVLLVINICGYILKNEADKAKKELSVANTIKGYLVANIQRYKSFDLIARDVLFDFDEKIDTSDRKAMEAKKRKAIEYVKNFPEEFIPYMVRENGKDILGLQLIDEKATKIIDTALDKMLTYYQGEIVHYMTAKNTNTVTYQYISDSIDDRCYPDIIDRIVANSKGVLIPYSYRDSSGVVWAVQK
jgi:hypothetical protein